MFGKVFGGSPPRCIRKTVLSQLEGDNSAAKNSAKCRMFVISLYGFCSAQSLGGAHPFYSPSPFLVIIGRVWSRIEHRLRSGLRV